MYRKILQRSYLILMNLSKTEINSIDYFLSADINRHRYCSYSVQVLKIDII